MNIGDSVNIQSLSSAALEKALAGKLRELLAGILWLSEVRVDLNPADFDRIFDLSASFQVPDGPTIELWVDVKKDPRPAHFPYVNLDREFEEKKLKRVRVRVFAAPHISPRMAEICESHGWSWFDLAGNCRISVPRLLHLQHTGNPPVHARPRPKANLGTKEAGRVVRALLSHWNAGNEWTQRSMQMMCKPDVSLGLVNKVVRHLQDESFLRTLPNGGFQLAEPLKLLFAWRDAYQFEKHERYDYFTLLNGRQLEDAIALLSGGPAALACFSAADIQAPHVRQPKTWLFIGRKELDHFAQLAQAKPVESGGNLIVLVPSDNGVFFQGDSPASNVLRLGCTNAVQTYVDLWHCGGRGKEAAEALLEQNLKPAWRACGYTV